MRPRGGALVGGGLIVAALTAAVPAAHGARSHTAGPSGFGTSWTVYHGDAAGDGVDQSGASLAPAAAAWTSATLDGPIYGEPLVAQNLVVVATENNTVYALSPGTGTVMWSTHIAAAVPSGSLPCGNIGPTVGITGTPVIDTVRNEVFVVDDEPFGNTVQHYLVGLDLSTGSVQLHQAIALPGADQEAQLQRTGLALDNGQVLAGFGGNAGDCGAYWGWITAIPETGGTESTFQVAAAPNDGEGAVWMGGAAPEVDSSGDIWFASGNSSFSSATDAYDDSDGVIELDASLHLLQSYAPSSWYADNGTDADLGSSSPALLGNGLVFQAGKSQTAYALSASALGGVGGELGSLGSYCGADVDGGHAVSADVVYAPCGSGVEATQVDPGSPPTITPLWQTSTGSSGPPIVAGGFVWTVDPGSGTLYGLDPATGDPVQSFSIGSVANHFPTPTFADGLLLAASAAAVHAFTGPAGLPAPGFAIAGSSLPAATPGSSYDQQLSASGGLAPYKWRLVPGTGKPPGGIRLKGDGVLSGTARRRDRAGVYAFTVEASTHKVRGTPRQFAEATFTIQVP